MTETIMTEPTMTDPETLLNTYEAGTTELRDAVAGLRGDQFDQRPIAGTWSLREIICHLSDSEALFAERMKRVLAEDRPLLAFFDPDLAVTALRYQTRDIGEELACVESVRKQMTRILRSQDRSVWQRVGVHSQQGDQTLFQLLEKGVLHLAHHLSFIRQKRQLILTSADHVTG